MIAQGGRCRPGAATVRICCIIALHRILPTAHHMQLGLWLAIHPGDDLPRLTDRVAAMGFSALHAHFPAGCDAALARRVNRACDGSGLDLAAVSGYANPLRPELAPMGSTVERLPDLIELLPLLDARRVVSWSGTYGEAVGDDHPDNQGDAAWDALRRHVDELSPLLEEVDGILVLEPFFAHVLDTPERAAAFCRQLSSPYVRLVLDPPNLLPPSAWDRQAELVPAMVATLAPFIGLVHLKDMRLRDGAIDMPGPGQGALDYHTLLAAVTQAELSAPLIVEHVGLDQAAAARRFVLDHRPVV
jgi:sugar phosphate isomerase/epimerase